jgi:hypothetical protein
VRRKSETLKVDVSRFNVLSMRGYIQYMSDVHIMSH